eukprot:scaffold10637_cov86-Isochrysis_galbana.AAC.3
MGRPQRGRPVPDTSGLDWRLRSRPNRSRQPGRRAGAKGLLLHAPGGRAAAPTSGDSCRAGRASTAA